MSEYWLDVPGYENHYQVSDFGRVRSKDRLVSYRYGQRILKGKIRSLKTDPKGYKRVDLHVDCKIDYYGVHTLVLMAFVGPRPEGLIACHFDGNPANNQVNNLRWDTASANVKDSLRHGTHVSQKPKDGTQRDNVFCVNRHLRALYEVRYGKKLQCKKCNSESKKRQYAKRKIGVQ